MPSDGFLMEASRLDRENGMIVLLLMLAWLGGLLIGACCCSGVAIATDSQSSEGTSSTMTAKAQPRATLRAVGSKGGRDRRKGDASGDHENPAPPLPGNMDLARPTAVEPEVFVTQFGHKYHRRNDCTGLNGARLVYGPYAACSVCVKTLRGNDFDGLKTLRGNDVDGSGKRPGELMGEAGGFVPMGVHHGFST